MTMSSTINVHRPEVEAGELGVYRQSSSGDLTITLASNSSLRVTMFATDEQWDAIVDRVAEFRASEHVNESAPPRRYALSSPYVDETDVLDSEREELSQWFVCEECSHATERIDASKGNLCYVCQRNLSGI